MTPKRRGEAETADAPEARRRAARTKCFFTKPASAAELSPRCFGKPFY
jgi:hypothetical protein